VTESDLGRTDQGLVINRAPRPVLVYDPVSHAIVDANEPACQLYGYQRAELLQLRIEDLRPAEDVALLHDRLGTEIPEGVVERRGVRHQDREGNRFLVAMEAFSIEVEGRRLRVVRLRRSDDRAVTGFEHQALLFHGIREAVIFTDAAGIITDWNVAAERLWGYSREFALDRDARFLKPSEGPEQVDEIMTSVAEEGVWEGTLKTEAADGSARFCEVRVLPIHDEGGRLVGTVGINRDVTEARRMEQALQESAEELRVLADQLPHTLWVTDAEGRLAYVNEPGHAIAGAAENLRAETAWNRVVHPEERVATLERWEEALAEGTEMVVEHRLRGTDGGWRWHVTRATPVLDAEGRVTRWVGSSVDIASQKSSEETIRRREEYFRSVFEHAHDAIVLFDLETGHVLDANPEAERLYGYETEAFRRQSLSDLYEDANAIKTLLNEVEHRGFGSEILTQQARHGEFVQVEVNAALMDHRDARVLLTINRDLSERRRLEARLQRAEKLEAVGRLAGGLAHDFNNLTTAILGFAGLLSERVGDDSEAREALQEIHVAAQRASELTRQLLAYTRQQVMRGQVLDMNDVVESSLQLLSRLIGEDIEIITDLDPDIGAVRADPGQINQVLMNLAVNARDAMTGGGRLTLTTANQHLDHEFADAHPPTQPGDYVRLRVADTGHGMSEEIRAHAFDPFFTTKNVGEGTGLGLATVYGIVKQSGGYIWVESEEEAGTTFDIYLPQVSERAEPEPIEPETPSYPAAGETDRTILLVEDEDAVRKLSRRVLERAGYTVLEASDGQEALELVEETAPEFHLLLTDMVMPRMSGKELAHHLADLYPETPVLFMTGYAGETLAERGDLTRTDVVLEKPFKPGDLVDAVGQRLETVPK
jgi:PAS domain S-box-containing protein